MKKISILLTTMLLFGGLVGCTNGEQESRQEETPPVSEHEALPDADEQQPPAEEQPPEQEESDQEAEPNQPSSDRPSTKQEEILLEGMPEEFNFTLVDDQALGFSTYVIEDMMAEQLSSTDGDALLVYVMFGGVKNEQAAIRVFSPKREAQVEMDELINSMKEQFANLGLQMEETTLEDNHPFLSPDSDVHVQDVYLLMSQDIGGIAIFFEHNQRPYVLYYHFPHEYGDGFSPRVNKFIEDIVWYE